MVERVHVAIDFDRTNLGLLPGERQKQMVQDIGQFATDLRRCGVPTIWISFPKGHSSFQVIDAPNEWPARNPRQRPKKQLLPAGYGEVGIKTDEDIFVKGSVNSFEDGSLEAFIRKKYGASSIIATGGTTTVCVPETLRGGLAAGFEACVVTNLCYTTMGWDPDPAEHRNFFMNWRQELPAEYGKRITVNVASQLLSVLSLSHTPCDHREYRKPSPEGSRPSARHAAACVYP